MVCILGIGCKQSQTVTNNISNNILSNVAMTSSSNCSGGNFVTQLFDISDLTAEGDINISNISQNQTVSYNFSCMQNSSQDVEQQTKLANEFQNELTNVVKGLPLSSSDQKVATTIANNLETNISFSNLASCLSTNVQNQTMKISDLVSKTGGITVDNISQTLVSNLVEKCLQEQTQAASIATELDNFVKTESYSYNEGLYLPGIISSFGDAVGNILSSSVMGIVIPLIIGVVVFVVMIMILKYAFKNGDGNATNNIYGADYY